MHLGNGTELSWAVADGYLLGLRSATVDGVALKSDETVVRPFLLQEWVENPVAWERMRVRAVDRQGESIRLETELLAGDGNEASWRLFEYRDGEILRDPHRYPHTRLASVITRTDEVRKWAADPTGKLAGTLTWVIEPVDVNVAGWPWKGWKHHYEFQLVGGGPVNCLRELGTWETEGTAVGNTLVNLRYRGLGGIVRKLEAAPDERGIALPSLFSTAEIFGRYIEFAGWPSVRKEESEITSRAIALKHREASWGAQPQRGGGVDWIDFQFRPGVALAAWYERMEAIRSCTEVWPGDREVSQVDGLYFPRTDRQSTVPKWHLALVTELPEHEWHTRWQEVNLHVRDQVSRELGFVQQDPLPTAGFQFDTRWADCYQALLGKVGALRAAGVKRVIIHQPGWFNGRGLRQKETEFPIPLDENGQPDTGGACEIHDYVPQSPVVAERWKEAGEKLSAAEIQLWVWATGMVYHNGPAAREFGTERFTRNQPGDTVSTGYPPRNFGITLRDPEIRAWWDNRLMAAVRDRGVQGFWADSFHNMYMNQMNYQHPDWAPQVREWWEWIAQASRQGVGWMSEGQGFPSLSCSIEVHGSPEGWEGIEWTMPFVTRWYRYPHEFPYLGTDQADRLFFRAMANKGGIAPGDGTPTAIPTFDRVTRWIPAYPRMSAEYGVARPVMQRPYQLPDGGGVLWLPNGQQNEGVLFAFSDGPVPAGVQTAGVLDGEPVQAFAAHRTYRVEGEDLRALFNVRTGPLPDPR